WQEPIDRNVFGLLEQFGDAELAAMIAPRALTIEAARGPTFTVGGDGAAPGEVWTPDVDEVRRETNRARKLVGDFETSINIVAAADGSGAYGSEEALSSLLKPLAANAKLAPAPQKAAAEMLTDAAPDFSARMARQIKQ